jgi:hypothetical protein
MMIAGTASVGAGMAACIKAKDFNWYNGSFTATGLTTVLLGYIGLRLKFALAKITCFLILVLIVFILHTAFTIGVLSYSDFQDKVGEDVADPVKYVVLAASILILCHLVFGYLYRKSLHGKLWYNKNEGLINEGSKVSKETPKTDSSREEMYKRYPQLKERNKV